MATEGFSEEHLKSRSHPSYVLHAVTVRELEASEKYEVVVTNFIGVFQRYLEEKKSAGFDLAHLKPPHINASDEAIESLLGLRNEGAGLGR